MRGGGEESGGTVNVLRTSVSDGQTEMIVPIEVRKRLCPRVCHSDLCFRYGGCKIIESNTELACNRIHRLMATYSMNKYI